jgi:hypothetical protein
LKKENEEFWARCSSTDDMNDNLTELADHIAKNVGATGVYIGKLE